MRFPWNAFDILDIHVPAEIRDEEILITNADLAEYLTQAEKDEKSGQKQNHYEID